MGRGGILTITNRAKTTVATAIALACIMHVSSANGDPLRLRGDAYAQTPQPSGMLVLQGDDRAKPWLSAEALAWLGTGADHTGDVLTLVVRARDVEGRGEARAGRFLMSTGAIRPLHIDGASAIGRTPWGTSLEAFGGVPVVPRFGERDYDWAVGGRLAQRVMDRATLGFAYLQRRERGRLSDEEIGGDLAVIPIRNVDIATRAAYDLVSPGLTDALASVGFRTTDWRVELFGTRRSPSRLLPATSLFSVLGDIPSTRAGTTVRWLVAPRLDLLATAATTIIDDRVGGDGTLRATLRTNEEGTASVGLELRRQAVPGAQWSGLRAIGTAPIATRLAVAAEVEVAHADDPAGRGDLWPWALVALTWRATQSWDVAAAAEGASTATARAELTTLLRASYSWDGPR
jgi:hypothetical protein